MPDWLVSVARGRHRRHRLAFYAAALLCSWGRSNDLPDRDKLKGSIEQSFELLLRLAS